MNCGECGNVTAPGVGFPNHVYCKRFLLHMEKQEDASRCRYFIPTPITNADRIRGMSDEELAELIANYAGCAHCPGYHVQCDNRCKENWLDWLKQEAVIDE